MIAAELVRRCDPLVNDLGGRFYFAPGSLQRAAELGLTPSQWYFLGRGGALGDVGSSVVHSALGYFAPWVVAKHWDSGRAVAPPPAVASAHMRCCQDFGRRHLDGAPFLVSFVPAAAKVLAAADPLALPLFAGVKGFALADDLPGAAMQAVSMIREFGGGVHLLAVAAAGLEPRTAHWLTRPDAWANFGYRIRDIPQVSALDRRRLGQADELTRQLMEPAYRVLDDAEREDLVRGLTGMKALLPVPGFPG